MVAGGTAQWVRQNHRTDAEVGTHVELRCTLCDVQGYLAPKEMHPLDTYKITMTTALWRSLGGWRLLISEAPLWFRTRRCGAGDPSGGAGVVFVNPGHFAVFVNLKQCVVFVNPNLFVVFVNPKHFETLKTKP